MIILTMRFLKLFAYKSKTPPDKIKEENDSDRVVGSMFENVVISNQVIPSNEELQLSNHLPIITSIPPSPNFDNPFAFSRISMEEWDIKHQDARCMYDEFPSKPYKGDKIISVGPVDAKVFYYNLTSIAVELSKKFVTENQCERGWDKIPKKNEHESENR